MTGGEGSTRPVYAPIVEFAERCLEQHGDTFRGVGWTKSQEDADARYRTMLDVIRERSATRVSLLDFGCGASHLLDYIHRNGIEDIEYSGLDVSRPFLELSRRKHPSVRYHDADILRDASTVPEFDYVVLNGIFTVKASLTYDAMFDYVKTLILAVFQKARVGIAFNAMSTRVEWEREDLFHLPFDSLTTFLASEVSRYFIVRHDYGLYEYTAYVYRTPSRLAVAGWDR